MGRWGIVLELMMKRVVGDFRFNVVILIGAQSVKQDVIIYEDPGLKVYAMEWCWTFCRKLDRFNEWDEKDIRALLLHLEHSAVTAAKEGDVKGAAEQLYGWIRESCPLQIAYWQKRHFVNMVKWRIHQVVEALVE